MRDESYDRVARRWSDVLGVPLTDLVIPGVHVMPHARRLVEYAGVFAWRRERTAIISAPQERVVQVSALVGDRGVPQAFDAARLGSLPGAALTIGPAYQGYVDASTFTPAPNAHTARSLSPADADAIDVLRFQCDHEDWEYGGVDAPGAERFGCFDGTRLVAMARVAPREGLPDIGVVTHPMHRGRGHARAVVSATVADALTRDEVVQYQTLLANAAAVAVAVSLGFEQWCETIAVRLPPALAAR